jgi:hypothetical protein
MDVPVIDGAICIQYGGNVNTAHGFYIPACGLLEEGRVEIKWKVYFRTQSKESVRGHDSGQASFDFLAAIFFLLSRYEEYIKFRADDHGRFTNRDSLMHMKNWLHLPIIDYWIEELFTLLEEQNDISLERVKAYSFISTIDVDYPWKALYRRWPMNWVDTLTNRNNDKVDPYDTYDNIREWHQEFDTRPHFFFLVGGHTRYDHIQAYRENAHAALIQHVGGWAEVGLHPSYDSVDNPRIIQKEKARIEKYLGRPVFSSRQHYLRMRFPDTYRQLLSDGISADFTLGYAEEIGFRSGTCHSCNWYDLENEEVTDMKMYPLNVMDVTLKQYKKLDPDRAFERVKRLIDECKKYHGYFGLLWHNSSLSEVNGWEEWRRTYRNILSYASN